MQGHISPEETIRKTKHPEILTTVKKPGQTGSPSLSGQQQSFVAAHAEPVDERGRRDDRYRFFISLEIVKGSLDQERWQVLPWIPW
jgi:hypothetical protein